MVDVEVAPWLASLPLAPVYHPSEAEFADPVAYILKVEREAAQYGICKIVPPFSRAPDETALSNLNQSLAAIQEGTGPSSAHGASVPLARSMCSAVQESGVPMTTNSSSPSLTGPDSAAKFTTRRQQLGWNPRRPRGGSQYRAQKLVWESGEYYTLDQFREKARSFSSTVLGTVEDVNPLAVETLFWNAEMDKPISVEYANDIPGSAFLDPAELPEPKPGAAAGEQLAGSGWNVRSIARSHGSLLKFMADEVPGVTTPMVYLGMLFSWFAWHVEDHELHSLNYLHSGARKTWYAVPSEAAAALEEVIRLYGYGSRLSARAAFTLLGEKTTILSPEILIAAGVPCCRLEQNPGEYVITFPRAYHLGFSHGFNCGEAANFATPEWLGVAREAAARRAAMNHLPMLSHEQLLYLTAMSLPRGGRSLVDRALKSAFVAEVKETNRLTAKLLHLGVESCVFVKDLRHLLQPGGCAREALSTALMQLDNVQRGSSNWPDSSPPPRQENGNVLCVESRAFSPERYDSVPQEQQRQIAPYATPWGALPCATCGILCFACMALVQPCSAQVLSIKQRKQKACLEQASYVAEDDPDPELEEREAALPSRPAYFSPDICRLNSTHNEEDASAADLAEIISLSDDNAVDCSSSPVSGAEVAVNKASNGVLVATFTPASRSSLELLAETYREDSEDDWELSARPDAVLSSTRVDEVGLSMDAPWSVAQDDKSALRLGGGSLLEAFVSHRGTSVVTVEPFPRDAEVIEVLDTAAELEVMVPAAQKTTLTATTDATVAQGYLGAVCSFNCESSNVFSASDKDEEETADTEVAETVNAARHGSFQLCSSNCEPTLDADTSRCNKNSWKFSKGFPRPFMFCLQHALQAVTHLQSFGGAKVLVLCHSSHQIIQAAAEDIANETWEQIPLREASSEEVEIINTAIHLKPDNSSESNWFLKLGLVNRARKHRVNGGEGSKAGVIGEQQRAMVVEQHGKAVGLSEKGVLGSWCGRQWRASQVHPLLGGGKISSQMLSQILRKCDVGKYQNRLQIHRNGFARLVSLAKSSLAEKCPKRMRKEGWEGQDRVLTAAILRKSKRNAVLKTAREQAEERRKNLERLQETPSTLAEHGLCKQAVFSLECSPGDRQQELSKEELSSEKLGPSLPVISCLTLPASSGCQRNQSEVDSTTNDVKWHEVPVACSPSIPPPQLWSNDRGAICSASQQDTAVDDVHSEEQVSDSSKRLKKRMAGRPILKSKKLRSECDQNLQETEPAVEGEADETAHSSSDEYSLKTDDLDSEADSPKVLPCFTSSRKRRSRSKLRVKRATWDYLLSRLPDQSQKENRDCFPMSCVTEAEHSYLCEDVYRPKSRRRTSGLQSEEPSPMKEDTPAAVKPKRAGGARKAVVLPEETEEANNPFPCDIEGCIMSFCTEQELVQHKKNRCTYKGCGKRFFSHKYLVQHRRVHMDDRPLKCPWEGCSMAFKWAWARTEHIRVHTGERPYACPECDKTFRFVSDFSRHKRNTGHART